MLLSHYVLVYLDEILLYSYKWLYIVNYFMEYLPCWQNTSHILKNPSVIYFKKIENPGHIINEESIHIEKGKINTMLI